MYFLCIHSKVSYIAFWHRRT